MDELLHQTGVARRNDDQVIPVVLHVFQQDLDGLTAEVVAVLLVDQSVGLVDEQHPPQSLLDGLLGLDGGLAHEAGYQAGAVHLHQLALGEDADGVVDPGQQTGYGGLAGARVAQKDQVEGHGRDGQAQFLAQLLHLHQVDETLDVLLHPLQAAQGVQLGQHLVQVRGRERLVLHRGGLLFRWSAGLGPGDELVRFQGGPVPLQASAQGQQEVGAGIDKAGLRLADHVIHRSKEQQEQRQLVNEGAGQTAVGEAVILPETVKKGGGLELVKAGHPGGHLPVQGGGGGGAVGIDSVVELHMTGGDGTGVVRLPHPQGAAAEIAVRLPIEPRTQGRVRDEPAECGDHLIVLLVDGSCGHGSFHSGHLFRVSGAGPGPQRADRFHYKRPGPGGQG